MLRLLGLGALIALGAAALVGSAMGLGLTDRARVSDPVLVRVPPPETTSTTARFAYRASGRRLAFACSLDGGRYRRCGPRRHAYANLPAGRHRFCVLARRGRARSTPACHTWTIVPPRGGTAPNPSGPPGPPGPPNTGANPQPFRITGTAVGLLQPGGPAVPVDLALANPNAAPITVDAVEMRVDGARPADCAAAITVVRQLAARPSVPGGATRTLSGLGIPPEAWPQLAMLDTGTNQNGCAGATIALRFTGRATG
jgi:hypothetical protein